MSLPCNLQNMGILTRFLYFIPSKMKNITINGDTYTYGRFTPVYNGKNDIFDLYDRPSTYKVVAFNEWNEKLVEIYGMTWNSCCFSIYGYVKDENGNLHNVKITRDYNWILD